MANLRLIVTAYFSPAVVAVVALVKALRHETLASFLDSELILFRSGPAGTDLISLLILFFFLLGRPLFNLVQQEPRYRRDHRAMRSKFRSRLGLCNGTGALFDEHTQAPPSDIIMIPYF